MICLIPARMGSKRIPNKNIKEFYGVPIINYSIRAAINSNLFTSIIISTDEPKKIEPNLLEDFIEIKIEKRSNELSGDKIILYDTIINYLNNLPNENKSEYLCVLYPCAPFVSSKRLIEGYKQLRKGYDVIFPITKSGIKVQQLLQKVECKNVLNNKVESKKVKMLHPSFNNQNSNDWQDTYCHASQWFFCNIEKLYENKTLVPENSGYIELPWYEAQDIDTIDDWYLAELKYSYYIHNEK